MPKGVIALDSKACGLIWHLVAIWCVFIQFILIRWTVRWLNVILMITTWLALSTYLSTKILLTKLKIRIVAWEPNFQFTRNYWNFFCNWLAKILGILQDNRNHEIIRLSGWHDLIPNTIMPFGHIFYDIGRGAFNQQQTKYYTLYSQIQNFLIA